MNRNKKIAGFTLIEMLLVVAVLAVVGTMIVSQFGDTEKQARSVAAKHNSLTVQQSVSNFKSLYGVYPQEWHTGLSKDSTASVEGLSLQVALNLAANATGAIPAGSIANGFDRGFQVTSLGANVKALTAGQVRALRDNGIHQLYQNGYIPANPIGPASTPSREIVDTNLIAWVLEDPTAVNPPGKNLFRGGSITMDPVTFATTYTPGTIPVTINGKPIADSTVHGDAVVLLACSKEVNWKSVNKADANNTGAAEFVKNSQIGLSETPRDPNAKPTSSFPYYWAVFNLSPFQVGGAGISAQLLGVLDGDLNPVQG